MTKKYSLTEQQFLNLAEDSSIILPQNIKLEDIHKLESLLLPEFLNYYPGATNDFIKEYLKVILNYSRKNRILFENLETKESIEAAFLNQIKEFSRNQHELLNNFNRFCTKHDNNQFSSFIEHINNDNQMGKMFQKTILSNLEDFLKESNFSNIISLVDLIKMSQNKQPLKLMEKEGVLKFNATANEIFVKYIKQDFIVESSFAYPEYENFYSTYDTLFDYPFYSRISKDDESEYNSTVSLISNFYSLIIENSEQTLEFLKNNKQEILQYHLQHKHLNVITENFIENDRTLKFNLFSEILLNDKYSVVVQKELEKFQSLKEQLKLHNHAKSIFTIDQISNPGFKFLNEIDFHFNTSINNIYNLNTYDLNKATKSHDFQFLFIETLKTIFNSEQFLEISSIIAENKDNRYINDTLKHKSIFMSYPFLPHEVKVNLSSNILDKFLNNRKNSPNEHFTDEYNRGIFIPASKELSQNIKLYETSIFQIIPFFDANKKGILSYEQFFETLQLPSIDIDYLYSQPQIKLIINKLMHEIINLSLSKDISSEPIMVAIRATQVPEILFHLMDKFATDELNNPLSKVQEYSIKEKNKISLFQKENWLFFNNLFKDNNPFSFDTYNLEKSIFQAVNRIIEINPDFYRGKASQLSTFELMTYSSDINLSSILSHDFREITVDGKINKTILENTLIQNPEIFPKLPSNIKNSPEIFEITRHDIFFQKITGGNCPGGFSMLEIYNHNDAEFLINQLYNSDCEHSPDFTNRNSELLTLLPKENLKNPQFWIDIIQKELKFFGTDFLNESTIFDIIPNNILRSKEFFELLIHNFDNQTISIFPKDCFALKENILKLLDNITLDNNISSFEKFIKQKIPQISNIYKHMNNSDESKANLSTIGKIIITASENILIKTIKEPDDKKNKAKPIKF